MCACTCLGKLDLTQVEAVADLIAAETDAQRRQALHNTTATSTSLSKFYQQWTDCLLHACAHLDAIIDFGEEEDFHAQVDVIEQNVMQNVRRVEQEIQYHLRHYDAARKIRTGFLITLVGAPNVGKSSIINRFLRRQASIVSPIPGTTRDIIESFCEIGGYPVLLSDTAGVRAMQPKSGNFQQLRNNNSDAYESSNFDVLKHRTYPNSKLRNFKGSEFKDLELLNNSRFDNKDAVLRQQTNVQLKLRNSSEDNQFNDLESSNQLESNDNAVLRNIITKDDEEFQNNPLSARLSSGFDAIEAEGIDRAIERARESDIIVYVVDGGQCTPDELTSFLLKPVEFALSKLMELGVLADAGLRNMDKMVLVPVLNKSDLLSANISANNSIIILSCKTDHGFEHFAEYLSKKLENICESGGLLRDHCGIVTRQRQRDLLVQALEYIKQFHFCIADGDVVLAANELRMTLDQLAKLVGKGAVTSDELLDRIFNDFCIGK